MDPHYTWNTRRTLPLRLSMRMMRETLSVLALAMCVTGLESPLPLGEWLPGPATMTNASEPAVPEVIHFVWVQETRQRQAADARLPPRFAAQRKPRMLQDGAWEDSVYARRFADNVARWRRLNPPALPAINLTCKKTIMIDVTLKNIS